MTLYYKLFEATDHPKNLSTFTITANSWHIYLLCSSEDLRSCHIYTDAHNLQKIYLNQYRTMMRILGQHCESGLPLTNYYDKKSCHDVKDIDLANGQKEKIWRIRQGRLRLYFVYLPPERRLILLRVLVKNDDKLNKNEENSLVSLAKQVMTDCRSTFKKRIIQ